MTISSRKSFTQNSWVWRKPILPADQETWAQRLDTELAGLTWGLDIQSSRRFILEVFNPDQAPLLELKAKWGGELEPISDESWLKPKKSKPLRFGNRLVIYHDSKPRPRKSGAQLPRLDIPAGMAFGSGEHETTEMLLRALLEVNAAESVLDLGTGSGILALAARKLGATRVMGIDFEADSVRICKENEGLNFPKKTIAWEQADLKTWAPKEKWRLILANLYSDLLIELAPRIGKWLAPGGSLWVSGIMKKQAKSVEQAYEKLGFIVVFAEEKGKWVMLRMKKPIQTAADE
jgi:ribosomal protein L11 methyltransferase